MSGEGLSMVCRGDFVKSERDGLRACLLHPFDAKSQMIRRRTFTMRPAIGFIVTMFFCQVAAAAPFRAGLAAIDITPPVGWRMSGYFYKRLSTGTHDPLQAKAMVLQQGDERVALVFCDLIGVPATLTGPV